MAHAAQESDVESQRLVRRRTAAPLLTEAEVIDAAVRRAEADVEIRLYRAKRANDSYEYNEGPSKHWAPTLELWHTLPWHNNWTNILLTMLEYSEAYGHLPFLHVHIVLPSPSYRRLWLAGEEPEHKSVATAGLYASTEIPTPDDIHVLTITRSQNGYWRVHTQGYMDLWPQERSATDDEVRQQIQQVIHDRLRAIVERRLFATQTLVDELAVLPRDVAASVIAPYMLSYKLSRSDNRGCVGYADTYRKRNSAAAGVSLCETNNHWGQQHQGPQRRGSQAGLHRHQRRLP